MNESGEEGREGMVGKNVFVDEKKQRRRVLNDINKLQCPGCEWLWDGCVVWREVNDITQSIALAAASASRESSLDFRK